MLNATDDSPRLRDRLAILGAQVHDDAHGPQARFGAAPATDQRLAAGAVALLPDLAPIAAEGPDAIGFLHTQLTNDVAAMPPASAAYNGYCSPKGRLLASLIVARTARGLRLLTSTPLVESLRKRLAMFVLRAKVSLHDERESTCVLGVTGTGTPAALAAIGVACPGPMTVTGEDGDVLAIGLAPVLMSGHELPRVLLIVAQARCEAVWRTLAGALAVVDTADWRRLDVLSGVPRVFAATVDAFVPQMVNYELVGGVSFKKGCYPGQEIVARSQYLGKLKRRMFLGHVDGPCAPGDPIEGPDAADPLGSVVMSAPDPGGGFVLLFEYRYGSAGADTPLRAAGRPLRLGALPYPVPLNAA